MSIEIGTLLLITFFTVLILTVFTKLSKSLNEKLVYLFITTSLFFYSGFGISYVNVDNKYIINYIVFLFCFLFSIRFTLGTGRKSHFVLFNSDDINFSIEKSKTFFKVMAYVYIATLFVYLITPNFRLQEFFSPPLSNAIGIHARAANKNSINQIADTLRYAVRPFFMVYLYLLVENNKKSSFFILIILWIYLEYLQLGYLSRYQMIIYLFFVILSTEIINYGELKLSRKTKFIILITMLFSVPILVAFLSLRMGNVVEFEGFFNSVKILIDGETYYPTYYDRINSGSWNISPITFIIWLIFLPIPSFIWSNKPYVDPSYALTTDVYSVYGMILSKSDANYYNSLPSMLGESMMIFGNEFYFMEAIIVGFFIGLYFRFLFRSKKLNVLTLYMTLMLLTLGRGGATSYMSGLINGTIVLILWIIFTKYAFKKLT